MAERKQARNIFYDTFAEAYLNHYGLPYNAITADFVGLDQITNKGPLAPRMTLEVFQRGVANYFASELGAHTLRHLCSKFVPYWRQPLDRYEKPKQKASQIGGEPRQSSDWQLWMLMECWKLAGGHNKAQVNAACDLIEHGAAVKNEAEARAAVERIKELRD